MKRMAGIIAMVLILAGCATPRASGSGWGHRRPQRARRGGYPTRAAIFLSPMGEPYHGTEGGAPMLRWFQAADKDDDGKLTHEEMRADALRFFRTLDVNGDGEIDPTELDRYEIQVAPEVRTGGEFAGAGARGGSGHRGRGGGMRGGGRGGSYRGGGHGGGDAPARGAVGERRQGAARFSILDIPEPVASADANFDRGISTDEFTNAAMQRFKVIDRNHDGVVTRDELFERAGP